MVQNETEQSYTSSWKSSFFPPTSYPLGFPSSAPDASRGVTLTREQHGTPCTAVPGKLNFWHIQCSLPLNTMSPLTHRPTPLPFFNSSILSQEKIKSSGGKIFPRLKRLQLCPQVQETEGMCGSLAVKWLSVLRSCTARWHNALRSVYVKLRVLTVSQPPTLRVYFFYFFLLILKGFWLKLIQKQFLHCWLNYEKTSRYKAHPPSEKHFSNVKKEKRAPIIKI